MADWTPQVKITGHEEIIIQTIQNEWEKWLENKRTENQLHVEVDKWSNTYVPEVQKEGRAETIFEEIIENF